LVGRFEPNCIYKSHHIHGFKKANFQSFCNSRDSVNKILIIDCAFLSKNLFCPPNTSIYSRSMYSLNNPSSPISHVSPLALVLYSSTSIFVTQTQQQRAAKIEAEEQRTKVRGDTWEIIGWVEMKLVYLFYLSFVLFCFGQ